MSDPASPSLNADRRRFGVTAAFWLDAEDEDEARTLVGNFLDSFPSQIDGDRAPDVLMQDVEDEGDAEGGVDA